MLHFVVFILCVLMVMVIFEIRRLYENQAEIHQRFDSISQNSIDLCDVVKADQLRQDEAIAELRGCGYVKLDHCSVSITEVDDGQPSDEWDN